MDENAEVPRPVVVPMPGEIDMTNAEVATRDLTGALAAGVEVVIADLTSTTFCDSAGIRALALAHQQASQAKVQLRLAVPPEGAVRRVLEIMDLVTVLPVYPSLKAALAASGKSG